MKIVSIAIAFAVGIIVATGSIGQTYPAKPVRVIIPISAGSGQDIIGRWVGQKLSATWGQPVVIDNRPGAGGTVGTAVVAKSAMSRFVLNGAGGDGSGWDVTRPFVQWVEQAIHIEPSAPRRGA